jgi:hypothetical protein
LETPCRPRSPRPMDCNRTAPSCRRSVPLELVIELLSLAVSRALGDVAIELLAIARVGSVVSPESVDGHHTSRVTPAADRDSTSRRFDERDHHDDSAFADRRQPGRRRPLRRARTSTRRSERARVSSTGSACRRAPVPTRKHELERVLTRDPSAAQRRSLLEDTPPGTSCRYPSVPSRTNVLQDIASNSRGSSSAITMRSRRIPISGRSASQCLPVRRLEVSGERAPGSRTSSACSRRPKSRTPAEPLLDEHRVPCRNGLSHQTREHRRRLHDHASRRSRETREDRAAIRNGDPERGIPISGPSVSPCSR